MKTDQLQFAISQYLDGTISAEGRAELERILAGDESARRMLEEFRALDGALSQSSALPSVKWERLAAHLSAVVAERGESLRQALARPVDERTEYAITQYLDGELPADDRPAMQQLLEADPAARQMAEDYRSLDRLLRNELPAPAVNWELLAGGISSAVDEAAQRSRWSIGWARAAQAVALAACILIAFGLVYHFYSSSPLGPRAEMAPVREVAVLTSDSAASGKPVIDIAVTAPSASVDGRYSFAAAGVVGEAAPQLAVHVAAAPLPPQDPFLQ